MSDVDFSLLAWLEKDANPFGVRCLYCRKFTASITTFTADPKIAERFSNPPDPEGKEYRGRVPEHAMTVPCSLAYACGEKPPEGPLFLAGAMEDKWNIHHWDGYLYFSRSWTGLLVFRAKAEFTNGNIIASEVTADSEIATADPEFILRQTDFLIKSHLLGREVPHPIPPDMARDTRSIGIYSFSQYGRRAAYATLEDTIGISGVTP